MNNPLSYEQNVLRFFSVLDEKIALSHVYPTDLYLGGKNLDFSIFENADPTPFFYEINAIVRNLLAEYEQWLIARAQLGLEIPEAILKAAQSQTKLILDSAVKDFRSYPPNIESLAEMTDLQHNLDLRMDVLRAALNAVVFDPELNLNKQNVINTVIFSFIDSTKQGLDWKTASMEVVVALRSEFNDELQVKNAMRIVHRGVWAAAVLIHNLKTLTSDLIPNILNVQFSQLTRAATSLGLPRDIA